MNEMQITPGITFPALIARQGVRTMYQIMVPNKVLTATFFDQIAESATQTSQRELGKRHASEIGEYINDNPEEYVLGSLTYAVDVPCTFTPAAIHPNVGTLLVPLEATLRCLDGQHRRQGLKQALEDDAELSEDSTAVLVYVEADSNRRRQMFSDMNATPKVVAKALNVSFDNRDPFARAAKALADSHVLLKGKTETAKARVMAGSENWYSLGAVFEALKRLQVGANGRVRLAAQYSEDAIIQRGQQFFDLLNSARPEFDLLRGGTQADVMRNKSILLSSTTLRALAGAIHILLTEDGDVVEPASYAHALSEIDFSPESPMWIECGFVAAGKTTPNARNQEVLAATRAIADALRK
jgi:DGQHR domain-containing protein